MNLLNVIQLIFHNNKHSNGKDTNLGDQIISEIENDLKQRAPKDILNYNKSIVQEPQNPNLYCLRGFAKESIDDFEGALNDYNQALQIDENYSIAYYYIGLLKLTRLNDQKGCLELTKASELGLLEAKKALEYYCEK